LLWAPRRRVPRQEGWARVPELRTPRREARCRQRQRATPSVQGHRLGHRRGHGGGPPKPRALPRSRTLGGSPSPLLIGFGVFGSRIERPGDAKTEKGYLRL